MIEPQLEELLKIVAEEADKISIAYALGVTIGLLLLNGSLQHIWSSLNALQLIAFIPLIQFNLPMLAQMTLKPLIAVVTFDFL